MGILANITHEIGNLSEYDSTETDSGDLSVVSPGLAESNFTLSALINDTTNIFGEKIFDIVWSTDFLRIRIHYNIVALLMATSDTFIAFRLLDGVTSRATITVTRTATAFRAQFAVTTDIGASFTGVRDLSTVSNQRIECLITRASSDVALDGSIAMFVEGQSDSMISGLDIFDISRPDRFRVGAVSSVDAGTSGTLLLDNIKLTDTADEIGAPLSVSRDKIVTTSMAAVSDIVTGRLFPRVIRWRGATTLGHTCVITDTAGKILWAGVANSIDYVVESQLSNKWSDGVDGLQVPTLGSGDVDIYYRP